MSKIISPGAEFSELFTSFEHTAFRLEVRDSYNSPREHELTRRYLAGELDDAWFLEWFTPWSTMVRAATDAGRRFARVRVVTVPLTDYSRLGVWASRHNNSAGEDIRYLERQQAESLELPKHDYWLFDSKLLGHMHFDQDDGRLTGIELIDDPAEIVRHNYWRDVAWHHAVLRDDFASQQNLEPSPSA